MNTDTATSAQQLYVGSEKIYPREIKGTFQTWRNVFVVLLFGLYYAAPWIQWGGRQAILFDLPARKFHIFALTLWPQDFFLLTLLLILAAISLFFFTAIAGRVWCGYACPQTVWTEIFIWMERWVEGSRAQQIKLAQMPWSVTKFRKRFSKQFLWVTFSLFTGLTFVGYFTPIRQLVPDFFTFDVSGWYLFWVLFYGFATYGNAGFLREQVCKYMCPYARFQSAMFDKDTLIVAYDETRGEPRSRGKKRKDSLTESGDCIDCGLCVQVCPTGIDIRDGLQYECIACAACIDACDEVMEKVGLPPKLIRYSSENRDQGQSQSIVTTLLRARVLVYAGVLALVLAGFALALISRSPFQVDVLRDRNALYRWNESNLENSYQLRIMNKSSVPGRYQISVRGLATATATLGGADFGREQVAVKPGEIGEFNLVVTAPASAVHSRSQEIELLITQIQDGTQNLVVEKTRFLAPRER